ncbi:UNVERIFIED_CONTAM: hypothetical protein HDU68_009545 [Siphonaria sp. JEL0065]|nr:hypothetical protein HDU68_009545 [Siphonaria sp. JEL0065]
MSSSFSALNPETKAALVSRLLVAKEASNKTFDEIATHLGVTNLYASQLFFNQTELKQHSAVKLLEIVPTISETDIALMKKAPFRSYDPNVIQEPTIYRLNEAIFHYANSIKAIVNEKCGDGIMSAIDLYSHVDVIKGVNGEDRVVVTLSGKYLPYIEQKVENDLKL